jgi:hypothetical protein
MYNLKILHSNFGADFPDIGKVGGSVVYVCSGHRTSQRSRRSWVRIYPGCKVFRALDIAMLFFKA